MRQFNSKSREERCPSCEGCGIVRDDRTANWKVALCGTCNGHGIVVVTESAPIIAYEAREVTKCKFAN